MYKIEQALKRAWSDDLQVGKEKRTKEERKKAKNEENKTK